MTIEEAFKKYTVTRELEYGIEITCIKGLWSVGSCIKEAAKAEAFHYFCQYYEDGEYD